ncbi:GNAT family N-acetyltransferase [Saccharomonospora sp. NPDC006951]
MPVCEGGAGALSARPATEADAALLLEWRNDPVTRQWSRNTDPVAPADHGAWLRRVLDSPDRHLFVIGTPSEEVGTVRFDRDASQEVWEVSITLAPSVRGKGMSAAVLAAGERALLAERDAAAELPVLAVLAVLATVHEDNAASMALFERAGYRKQSAEGRFLVLRKELENR